MNEKSIYRPRFTLRTLLVVVAVFAVGARITAQWWPGPRIGMNQGEVSEAIGDPEVASVNENGEVEWNYISPDIGVAVVFDQGRAVRIEHY